MDWNHLVQGTVRKRTVLIWFKERCGHGLESFGSRNSTDMDWTHLVQGTARTWTGIIWFKEEYGHGLDYFGSRNGADTEWTHLVQGTVRTRTGLFRLKERCGHGLESFGSRKSAWLLQHANKVAGCIKYTGIPSRAKAALASKSRHLRVVSFLIHSTCCSSIVFESSQSGVFTSIYSVNTPCVVFVTGAKHLQVLLNDTHTYATAVRLRVQNTHFLSAKTALAKVTNKWQHERNNPS
jgi:hypothetical protein